MAVGLSLLVAVFVFYAAGSAAAGNVAFVALALTAVLGSLLLLRPPVALVVAVATGATLLSPSFGAVNVLGARTTVAEFCAYAAFGAWVVHRSLGLVDPLPRVVHLVWLLFAAAVIGAAYGLYRGSASEPVQGVLRTMALYLMVFPLCAFYASSKRKALLERIVVGLCTATAVVELAFIGLGWPVYSDSPAELATFGVVSSIERVRPAVLELTVLALVLLVVRDRTASSRGMRGLWVGQILLLSAVLLFSFTRIIWLTAILAVLLAVLLRPGARDLRRAARGVLYAAVLIPSLLIGAGSGMFGGIGQEASERLRSVTNQQVRTSGSYTDRSQESRVAWNVIKGQPLLGVGVAQPFGVRRITYDPRTQVTSIRERGFIHNSWLFAWLLFGILGPIALAAIGWGVWRHARTWIRQLPPVDGARVLAGSLALLAYAISALVQPQLIHRPSIYAFVFAFALAVRPVDKRVVR